MKIKTFLILLPALLCFAFSKTSKQYGAPVSTGTTSPSVSVQDSTKKVKDTAAFVKNILAQKSKYLNKELGVLLSDLDIPVKSYTIINSRTDRLDGIAIAFDDHKTTLRKMNQDDYSKQPSVLRIIWATPVPAAIYNELVQKSMSTGNWNSAEAEFYAKQIVGDIR